MRNYLTILALCAVILEAKSQNTSVEKSFFGIQTGFLGIWANNEYGLSKSIALRSELGLDSGIWGGDFYERTGFLLTPVITLEPRWYYNLDKRGRNSKRTDRNSGNFIALKTSHHPDWFVISNYDNIEVIADVSIIPTWGIKRHIGSHLTYEAGLGIGYRYFFAKQAGFRENESEAAANLHLRIGYTF